MEKTIHFALFLFLVTGLLFGGCATKESVDSDAMTGSLEESLIQETADTTTVTDTTASSDNPEESAFVDGTYSQTADYAVPDGSATLGVTLTVKDGLVESVSIKNLATDDVSKNFINLFSDSVDGLVVGKPLSEIGNIGAINGSSLTPKGFNKAVQAIMEEAQG